MRVSEIKNSRELWYLRLGNQEIVLSVFRKTRNVDVYV
jgi:hypothetical protein